MKIVENGKFALRDLRLLRILVPDLNSLGDRHPFLDDEIGFASVGIKSAPTLSLPLS